MAWGPLDKGPQFGFAAPLKLCVFFAARRTQPAKAGALFLHRSRRVPWRERPRSASTLVCRPFPRLLVVAFLVASGCSVNTYKLPVEGFSAAASKASDAYAEAQTTVLNAHTEYLKQRALNGQLRVRFKQPSDCLTTSERCRLEVVASDKPQDLVPELGNITLLMREIVAYAASLQAVVNSDASVQVGANLAAAGGSINNLATDIAKLPGGAQIASNVSAFEAPSANLAAWIAGEYINLLQVDALRKATQGADPVIQQSQPVLEGAARAASDAVKATLATQLEQYRGEYLDAPSDSSKLEQLVRAASDYDKVLSATAPGIFTDMAKAHHDLTLSLAGQNVTLPEAFGAIQRFAAKADALHDIIEGFRAAQAQAVAKKM